MAASRADCEGYPRPNMSETKCVAQEFEGIRAPGCQCRECLRKEVANQQYFNVKLKSELKVCQERVEELERLQSGP